jgi:hypothetical protein
VLVKIWRQIKKEAPCRAIHGALSLMSRALHLHVYLAHPPIEYIYAIFSLINLFFYYFYLIIITWPTPRISLLFFFLPFFFSFLYSDQLLSIRTLDVVARKQQKYTFFLLLVRYASSISILNKIKGISFAAV